MPLRVDLDDPQADILALAHNLLRVGNPFVRKLGDVHQPVSSAEIDEGAEVGQRRDAAMANLTSLQLGEQPILLLRPPLLRSRALRQDEPVAAPIHLDDLEVERLTAHGAQLLFDLFFAPAAAQLDDLTERY